MLLGSTAVIRLKSPLAHVSYSTGSKVRPPDQKGEELADAKFCMCLLPSAPQTHSVWEVQMRAKSGHKGLHNVRAKSCPKSNRGAPVWLSPAVVKPSDGPVDEMGHSNYFETQRCNYPQGSSQLSSGLLIP